MINVALDSNGGVVTASSQHTTFAKESVNNGIRHTNNNWGGSDGGWNSLSTPSVESPEWIQIDFEKTSYIERVDVFTLTDSINSNTDPTLSDTFSSYGIIDFTTEYWDGAFWVVVDTVTSNNKVWRKFTWAKVYTDAIRISVTSAAGGYARITEVEAWESGIAKYTGTPVGDIKSRTGAPTNDLLG